MLAAREYKDCSRGIVEVKFDNNDGPSESLEPVRSPRNAHAADASRQRIAGHRPRAAVFQKLPGNLI